MIIETDAGITHLSYKPRGGSEEAEMWFFRSARDANAEWLKKANPYVIADRGVPNSGVASLLDSLGLPRPNLLTPEKSPEALVELWGKLITANASSVLAIGGGTLSDLAGLLQAPIGEAYP